MLNKIWAFLIITSIIVASLNGRMGEVSQAVLTASIKAVEISLQLLGPMILWLGLMAILKSGGLLRIFQQRLRPLIGFLFPTVPPHHPAAGAIILNLSASFLGMGNAATPFGIKAMQELKKLNHPPERASNAMCTLLALNTSSLTFFPSLVVSLRLAQNSQNPMGIVSCTLLATSCSTLGAVLASKILPVLLWKERL